MTTFPAPDEPTPPTGKRGILSSTSPQFPPMGRSAKPTGARALLWAALLVLIGIVALLIVLSA